MLAALTEQIVLDTTSAAEVYALQSRLHDAGYDDDTVVTTYDDDTYETLGSLVRWQVDIFTRAGN